MRYGTWNVRSLYRVASLTAVARELARYKLDLPLKRPRRRCDDNIKMDLQEVGCGVWTGSRWFRIGIGGRHL